MSIDTTAVPAPPSGTRAELAPTSPRGGELRAAIASEVTKLRSVRSTVWTLLATVAATVGIGALIALARVSRWDNMSRIEQLRFDATSFSLRGVYLAQIALGVLGVLVISSEYSTGMIRTTFTAVPQRIRVLTAKVVVFAAVALAVALVACFVAFGVGQSIFASKGANVSLGDSGVLRAVVGSAIYLTAVGLIGLALGTLLRRTAGAIATLFGLLLVAPALSQALPSPWDTDVGKFLPSGAGTALFSVRPKSDILSPGAGLAVLAVYVVVALAAAAFVLKRRDA
jgi:ABC-type transport system involved in multi-copper enzyme maturation permease subunit